MFYWFVLVSFNTRAKVKHLGGGVRTFFCLLAFAIELQFLASCLVAKQLLQMKNGVAQFFG